MGQQKHGVERMIQRREAAAGVAGHHPPAVDQEVDTLALIMLVSPDREPATTRGGSPVEMSRVVSFAIIAQALELVVGSQPTRGAQPQYAQAVATGQHRIS